MIYFFLKNLLIWVSEYGKCGGGPARGETRPGGEKRGCLQMPLLSRRGKRTCALQHANTATNTHVRYLPPSPDTRSDCVWCGRTHTCVSGWINSPAWRQGSSLKESSVSWNMPQTPDWAASYWSASSLGAWAASARGDAGSLRGFLSVRVLTF